MLGSLGRAGLDAISVWILRLALVLSRVAGRLRRRISRAWLLPFGWIGFVALALLVIPPLLNWLSGVVESLGIWDRLGHKDQPHKLGDWWTPWSVFAVSAAGFLVHWVVKARERVIVEEFVDYTSKDQKAVSGLATLLVTELGRLRELYGRVNDQLSMPASVGVRESGGAGASTEPGAFLSVRADEITDMLSRAVASEATVSVAGFKIPIGMIFALFGRIARGPRILGSVHLTEAGGGPTLTAQIGGRGGFTWRVDGPGDGASTRVDKAFLDPMVREIACRMFTDLTLRGSVRWQAIQTFTQFLDLYWESLRTPKNRAGYLRQAEGRLLAAVAEDETFGLAYYNLGVVYSQLAQAEYQAAQASEYVKKGRNPDEIHAARTDAARAAFTRAVALNRDQWEAIYALAVHEFARYRDEEGERDADKRRHGLQCIVHRCDRVLDLNRGNAQAYDLRGMAQQRLNLPRKAVRSHMEAVFRSWWQLCAAEYHEKAAPPTSDSLLPAARKNASAAVHNLASVHWSRAKKRKGVRRWVRMWRADRVFGQALSVRFSTTRAATLFDRGSMREDWGRPALAVKSYREALKIEPDNPVYWARLARAYAHRKDQEKARQSCESALEVLAPLYRRTLEAHPAKATVSLRDNTLGAVRDARVKLGQTDDARRVVTLRLLARQIQTAQGAKDPETTVESIQRLREHFTHDPWASEQLSIAYARALGSADRWDEAADVYQDLIEMLTRKRASGIRQHALYAKHAKALRRARHLDRALVEAASGLMHDPLSAVVRRELGKAHFALLQYEDALVDWQHTLWLTPNDPFLHWKVAFCHWSVAQDRHEPDDRRADLEQAAEYFEQAAMLFGVENVRGWSWSELWAGRTNAELGRLDPAFRHLRAAKGCSHTQLPARLLLGELHQAAGEVGLARHHFEKALLLQAERYPYDGDWTERVDADWGETLSVTELFARAQIGLGWCSADVDAQLDRALEHAVLAELYATEIPGQPRARTACVSRALDLQARVQAERGELEEALKLSRRAARLSPTTEVVLREIELYEANAGAAPDESCRARFLAEGQRRLVALRRRVAVYEPPLMPTNGHQPTT
jgi:tetratricopeptide (TPR) repeat protein